jgi:primosomal replication protein N
VNSGATPLPLAATPGPNQLELAAQVVERGPLRYTPAGLPALDLRLSHGSQVMQDGHPRQVSFEMHALGVGEVVRILDRLPVGTIGTFRGFLGKQRNGRGVVFHIQEFEPSINASTKI